MADARYSTELLVQLGSSVGDCPRPMEPPPAESAGMKSGATSGSQNLCLEGRTSLCFNGWFCV